MVSTPPDPDEGARPGEVPSGSLVERQLEEMIAAWESGGRPRAEEFLARHPGLRDEDAVRLVYEEACLRLERG